MAPMTFPTNFDEGSKIHGLWGHLPLLVRATSKESVEYILQALWRTRRTGLDSADRQIFLEILQLPNDSDLDPMLVCLRMLIRRCVYEDVNKDEIQNLFPAEVLPELQRLLTILLQKFQSEWRDDISKDEVMFPHLKALTWNMENRNVAEMEPNFGEKGIKFRLAKNALELMLKSMYATGEQLSEPGENEA